MGGGCLEQHTTQHIYTHTQNIVTALVFWRPMSCREKNLKGAEREYKENVNESEEER